MPPCSFQSVSQLAPLIHSGHRMTLPPKRLLPQLALNPLENDPDPSSNLLTLQPQYEGQMWDVGQSAP
ncbi:hypothetical protein F7725_027751 [Dissostichus mawsoni]|uniref:Uncharacterized protein n=1 Tax=Dissostichus mawsoni TaxID=36200 RepID=A0A7J5XEA7_DISMA|nr:hypothetical protein F7725_027751 [Dissostichus mawsoni]